MEELKDRGATFEVSSKDRTTLAVPALEQFLKANEHLVEEFTWVTAGINQFEASPIANSYADNIMTTFTY